jgi:formamidopyrimidine-DNA glycosylase
LPKNRVVPHKPKREEAKAQEMVVLKQENNSLKRRVKRLEKEIKKRGHSEEEAIEDPTPTFKAITDECPECGSPVSYFTLAGKAFHVCGECKWRRKAS